jgi:hypothetical protein
MLISYTEDSYLLCALLNEVAEIKKLQNLKGLSHEKVDELRVWGVSLGPN